MAAGRAEKRWRDTGEQVAILDRANRPRVHDIWSRNPAIDVNGTQNIRDAIGCRGYIVRFDPGPRGVWDPEYRNMDHPGRIYPPPDLQSWAERMIADDGVLLIEPHVRRPSSPNKAWGFDRWCQIAEEYENVVQVGADPTELRLPGAHFIETPTYWHAAAIIEQVAMVMCTEGGMHHMAGALRVPAVVIYGGFVTPKTTGYDWHACLSVDDEDSPCGRWDPCPHCDSAMASITPDMVIQAADGLVTTA